jgi:crossover junction endodeoxyribonuclease RuvC
MIILGIDPGTAKMGYGIVEIRSNNKPRLVETNDIITPAGMDMHKRLRIIYRSLNGVIKDYSPQAMVIERLFFNTNVKTAMSVGQARGVALLSATNRKMDIHEYTALEAKKLLAGYGRANKKEMQEAVKEILGLTEKVKSDDANDAVAMALCLYINRLAQDGQDANVAKKTAKKVIQRIEGEKAEKAKAKASKKKKKK